MQASMVRYGYLSLAVGLGAVCHMIPIFMNAELLSWLCVSAMAEPAENRGVSAHINQLFNAARPSSKAPPVGVWS
jgi:hypothetical protein